MAAVAFTGCGGGGSGSQQSTPEAGGGRGAQLFASNGCSGCHTLAKAGANGTTGPNLDTQLPTDAKAAGMPIRDFARQSIVEPDAFIAKGYSGGLMPQGFGKRLSSGDLEALVDYITSTGN